MKNLEELNKILQNHERRLIILEGKKAIVDRRGSWYKSGSTVDKLIRLISEGFFNAPRGLKEIIAKLAEKDFHFKPSDLTLPLRKVVRKNLLRKTKQLTNGVTSKKWLYVKT